VEGVDVTPDAIARVVVSGSTGAVVLGGDVRLSQIAIAYEGYSVEIRAPDEAERRATDTLKLVNEGTTLADVVRGLNALGVTPRQLIDILESLSRAGALHAELEVVP
ncbi:MAG TPA: flagellar basal body P-ring protein FlgI, partial [Myxococcota bacterium]|nr:flagellar basal body P-ring protein FlgI [Myxococcota bacterium]